MPLKAAGKMSLPLSSTLALYSPKNLIIVKYSFFHAIGHKCRYNFPFSSIFFQTFPQTFQQCVPYDWVSYRNDLRLFVFLGLWLNLSVEIKSVKEYLLRIDIL